MLRKERLPLLGRQVELDEIATHLEAVKGGEGRAVFVAGEPGIGKTRLLREISTVASASGWQLLYGRAYDSESMPPYLPLVEALRDYVRNAPVEELRARLGANAAEVARVIGDLRSRLSDIGEPHAPDSEVERYRLIDALTQFVVAIARAAAGPGVVMILDDLHWADRSTLLFIQHLAHHIASERVLLAGSYRTIELHRTHPLAAVLADLRREGISERLVLPPLGASDVRDLVASLTGTAPAAGLLEMIMRRTDGNPFFVRELALHLDAEGLMQIDGSAAEISARSVPQGIREVIERRLAPLGGDTLLVLQAAAVVGGGSLPRVLQAISGIGDMQLLDALDEAVGAGILREDGDRYEFTHALIQETIYSKLSVARAQRLHLAAALALESELTQSAGEIAEHYRRAGPVAGGERTIDAALRAGEEAVAAFAYEQALDHWKFAYETMTRHHVEPARCIALLERLAVLTNTMGFDHYPDSEAYWLAALQLSEATQNVGRAAYIRIRLGVMYASNNVTMNIPLATAHLKAAELGLADVSDAESSAYLWAGFGSTAVWAARTADGLAASTQGMQLAEKLGHQALWVYSAINHGWHQVSAGALTEGLGLLERAWQTADRINRTTEAYRATSFAGNRYFLLDDPKAAAACYARELAKPRLVAALTRRLALISSQAVLSAVTGDLVTARTLLDQVDPHTFPQDSAMLAEPMLAFWSGDWDAAEAIWSEQRDRYQRVGNRWGVADYACWLARLRQVRGDLVGASQLFTDALSIAVEGPIIPIELKTRTALAHIAVELHDAAAARAHLRRCYDLMAGGENWRGLLGRVALAEGEVLMASGDQHRAEEAFARAVEIFQQHDLVWDTAEAYLTWSRITGAKAFEKRQRALDIYQLHEAGTAWIQRALPSHSRARRDRVYPDGLSQREVQVVRLVAAGMTNREIAATLVISRNTVERHVNHILMKTGSVNRTQVAAYAHRHSLITE